MEYKTFEETITVINSLIKNDEDEIYALEKRIGELKNIRKRLTQDFYNNIDKKDSYIG